MDPVKLLFAIRIRFLNAWYCQRHTKTKQLFSPDNNQAVSRTGNQTTRQKQQTHGLDTITQILKSRVFVKKVIDWVFCMENQLFQTEWSAAGWLVAEVCVAMVDVISSWRVGACSACLKRPVNHHMTLNIFLWYLKLSVQSNLSA